MWVCCAGKSRGLSGIERYENRKFDIIIKLRKTIILYIKCNFGLTDEFFFSIERMEYQFR